MIPENFIYFSLVLNTISETNLRIFLSNNEDIQDIIQKRGLVNVNFIHNLHCTLFHKNHKFSNEKIKEEFYKTFKKNFEQEKGKLYSIRVVGWGYNNHTLALLIEKNSIDLPRLENHIYHITVCTFENGKPYESNYILNWRIFKNPFEVDCILVENTLK